MATERQIAANRANALKSTGPVTPEGRRICSQSASLYHISGTVVLEGESKRRFTNLAAALIHHFKPRNAAETLLVQTMIVARWRLLRMWGMQTVGFEKEMFRAGGKPGSIAESGAVLAADTFHALADNSCVLAFHDRYEAAYDRQFHRALNALLKLRKNPEPRESSLDLNAPAFPLVHLDTATWGDDPEDGDLAEGANFRPPSDEESQPL